MNCIYKSSCFLSATLCFFCYRKKDTILASALWVMTHATDEGTMIYAAHEERRQLSAGRRDPEQTHSVAHSHTDTQSAKSSRKKNRGGGGGGGKSCERHRESLCIEHSLLFLLLQQACQSVSQSLSPDAAGRSGWAAMKSALTHTHAEPQTQHK